MCPGSVSNKSTKKEVATNVICKIPKTDLLIPNIREVANNTICKIPKKGEVARNTMCKIPKKGEVARNTSCKIPKTGEVARNQGGPPVPQQNDHVYSKVVDRPRQHWYESG
jgi:hypothetical protein